MSKYKIFISYAHIDNQTIANQEWVDEFHKNLSNNIAVQLGRREYFDIWFDKTSLQGHARLTEEIKSKVCEADIFVMILSRGYLASDWCMEELKTFVEYNSSDDNLSNIFIIQKESLSIEKKPSAIQDIWGYEFWFIDDKTKCRTYRSNHPKKQFKYFELIEDVSLAIGEYLESGKIEQQEEYISIRDSLSPIVKTPSVINQIFLIFNQSNSSNSQYSVMVYIHYEDEYDNKEFEFSFSNIYDKVEQSNFVNKLINEAELDDVSIHFILPPSLFLLNFKQWEYEGNRLVNLYHIILHNQEKFLRSSKRYKPMIEKWDELFEPLKNQNLSNALFPINSEADRFNTRERKIGVCFRQSLSDYNVIKNILIPSNMGLWQYKEGEISDYCRWVDGNIFLKDLNYKSRECDYMALLWDDMRLLEKVKNRR